MVGLFKHSPTLGASKFLNSNPRGQKMCAEKPAKLQRSESNEKTMKPSFEIGI